MDSLSIEILPFGSLRILGQRLHDGKDFLVKTNCTTNQIDYLIFLDSRGVSRCWETSLANKIISWIAERGKNYLLLCRPLELTTWATLLGFLKGNNQLNIYNIVTNMGFVDFTPKKLSLLQDAVMQVEASVGVGIVETYIAEDVISSVGFSQPIYAMRYSDKYREMIEEFVAQLPTIIINTPITKSDIEIERQRPKSFFDAQLQSVQFNQRIRGTQVIDLPDFDESMSYDAVHYTDKGNQIIFELVRNYL